MKHRPVASSGGRLRTSAAASAMISGLRAARMPSSPPTTFCTAAVAMRVCGHRQLAAVPSCRCCSAKPCVSIVIPYLLSVYGACCASHFGSGSIGGDRVRTRPCSDANRCSRACDSTLKVPRTLMSSMRSYRFAVSSPKPASAIAEALFTTMSMPPNSSAARATAAATASSSRTSPTIGSARPPASSIAAAAVCTVPGSRGSGVSVFAMKATFAPSAASRCAIASPMPRLPPVMKTVRLPPMSTPSCRSAIPFSRRRPACVTRSPRSHWPPRAVGSLRTVLQECLLVELLPHGAEVHLPGLPPLVEVLERPLVLQAQIRRDSAPLVRRRLDPFRDVVAQQSVLRDRGVLLLVDLADDLLGLLVDRGDRAPGRLRLPHALRVAVRGDAHDAAERRGRRVEDDLLVREREGLEARSRQLRAHGPRGQAVLVRAVADVRRDVEGPALRGRQQLRQRAVDGAALQRFAHLDVPH